MLSRYDIHEYRLLSNLSLRDVARYCNISAQMIGAVERGEYDITESTYDEIVKGINTAKQSIARGTFEGDKAKERIELKTEAEKKKAEQTLKAKPAAKKVTEKKATTKTTANKA